MLNCKYPNITWKRFTVWKNAKLSLTKKLFREINSLVTSLVKTVLPRNFSQKCVRENFRNFLTEHQITNLVNFLSKTNAFTKCLRKKHEREFLQFPHCAHCTAHCGVSENFVSPLNFSVKTIFTFTWMEINYFSYSQ